MRDELRKKWKGEGATISERLSDIEDRPGGMDQYRREVKQAEEYRTFFEGRDYDPAIRENFRRMDAGALEEVDRKLLDGADAIPTPFEQLNEKCGDMGGHEGYARGWHTLIVGLTGAGKSLLGSQFMLNALECGVNCCYVSNEMSRTQLVTRLYAQTSSHPKWRMEPGEGFDPGARKDARKKLTAMDGVPFINENPVRTVGDLEEVMVYHRDVRDVELFVVDYLQLIGAPEAEGVAGRIREISHRVRDVAKELDAVSVSLSQFNRKQTAQEPPSIFRLKGGSTLEQDSDVILLLDHQHYQYNETANESFSYIEIGKNRHGNSGAIPILWDWDSLKAVELETDMIPSWVKSENMR